jgi:hypothetical protein
VLETTKVTSPRKSKDLVLVHGRTPDGNGLGVLRAREQRLEVGTLRPLEEGKPIHGEVVKLSPRPEMPNLFDAETEFVAPASAGASANGKTDQTDVSAKPRDAQGGPPQVATAAYRKNWDAIWSRQEKRSKLVN